MLILPARNQILTGKESTEPGADLYSFLRSWEFDVCVFVQLSSVDYGVVSAVEVPRAGVELLTQVSAHVNASRVRLTDDLLQVQGAVDRTAEFCRAFEAMSDPVRLG